MIVCERPVLIKSNKYGITVFFQQELPFEQLMEETLEKFRSAKHFFNHAEMVVEFEGRAFTEEEILRMADAIQTAADIQILCLLERDTRTEEIHKQAYHESCRSSMKETACSIKVLCEKSTDWRRKQAL